MKPVSNLAPSLPTDIEQADKYRDAIDAAIQRWEASENARRAPAEGE